MVIEVTSVSDRRRPLGRVVRAGLILFIIVSAIAGDALIRSYAYYSQIIDARLATGFLTS